MQLRSGTDLANLEAVQFVWELARKEKPIELRIWQYECPQLCILVQQIHLLKSKGSAMVERGQAESDATEKAIGDKELTETSGEKKGKTAEIDKMSTILDQMSTRPAQLKAEVAALQNAPTELTAAQAEMDKLHRREDEAFKSSKGGHGERIVQCEACTENLDQILGGIIGLLEVVETDFSKALAEAMAAEEGAQTAYDKPSKENEIDKTMKEQDIKYKTKKAADLDKATADQTSDRSDVQAELAVL